MSLTEAVQILRDHNAWRRDKDCPPATPAHNGKTIGLAIDLVCDVAPRILDHLKFAHAALRGLPGIGSSAQVQEMGAVIARATQ